VINALMLEFASVLVRDSGAWISGGVSGRDRAEPGEYGAEVAGAAVGSWAGLGRYNWRLAIGN